MKRMAVLAIDPGPTQSAWVIYNIKTKQPEDFGWEDNDSVIELLSGDGDVFHLAVEMVANMGMNAVGDTLFETCLWVGRFIQAWGGENYTKVYRGDAKMHLCGTKRSKNKNVRQAILDRYEPSGGGATPQIGTKKDPGPLYGVSKHVWAALAVAITWAETSGEE